MQIILEVHKGRPEGSTGAIRVSPEAEAVLLELVRATGLSVREIASRIIVQAADLVEIREVE